MRAAGLALAGALLLLPLAACSKPNPKEGSSVLLPVPEDPTVSLKLWFRVGSQNDPPGKEGLAWLTAQLMTQGSTTSHSYEEILDLLYPLASSYSVRVDREMTTLAGRTHRDNLDAYFELYLDAFLRPAFTAEDFERLRTDALNYLEKSLRYASDEELAKAALYRAVFENTRYAHPPQGTVAGLKNITLDDVRAFYEKHFTRHNATPALGGGYDDVLVERFERAVGELPDTSPVPAPEPEPAAIEGIEVVLVDKPGADASISFGFPLLARRGEREFYALWLANSWLGEHRNSSSRLYQVIREARGMNYGDYSYIEAFPQGGFRRMPPTNVGRRRQIFEVWIRTLPVEDAHFALRAAIRELKHLVDNGLTEEQFELTRSFLSKYCLHFAETTEGRLGYAVDDAFYGVGDDGHLSRFRRMMQELTLDEVNAAIRKHLQVENLKIAMVTDDAAAMRQRLADGAPSPKSYRNPKGPAIVEEDREIAAFPLEITEERVRIVPVDEFFEN